jgi:hypothetical protein
MAAEYALRGCPPNFTDNMWAGTGIFVISAALFGFGNTIKQSTRISNDVCKPAYVPIIIFLILSGLLVVWNLIAYFRCKKEVDNPSGDPVRDNAKSLWADSMEVTEPLALMVTILTAVMVLAYLGCYMRAYQKSGRV